MPSHELPAYRRRLVAVAYDLLNAVLWFPTGSDRLRRELVNGLDLAPGMGVLELGCGTGLATRHLVSEGAALTAIDSAPTMLAAARRRVPEARFIEGDLLDRIDEGPFDRLVCSFVLHELDPERRAAVLATAAGLLAPGGRIGILEWATPARPMAARLWRAVVRVIEPAVAHDVLDDGIEQALHRAGLLIATQKLVAAGRARIVIAAPRPRDRPATSGPDEGRDRSAS